MAERKVLGLQPMFDATQAAEEVYAFRYEVYTNFNTALHNRCPTNATGQMNDGDILFFVAASSYHQLFAVLSLSPIK
jgi:hypothetical protein